jgi:hypothetical protein
MHYFLWIDETQQGPYEKRQILDMLLSGSITKQTLCCHEGASEWSTVGTIVGLLDPLAGDARSKTETTNSVRVAGRDGQEIGVYPENDIPELLAAGKLQPTDYYWRDGMPEWRPVSEVIPLQPPSLPARPASNVLAWIALVLPLISAGIALFKSTSGGGFTLSVATILTTATLLAIDASRLGRERAEAVGLFFGMLFLWIVFYPAAFFRRRQLVQPNLGFPALIVAVLFLIVPFFARPSTGTIKGQVFIVTKGGQSIKLGGVAVKAIPEAAVDAWIKTSRDFPHPDLRVANLPLPYATTLTDADGYFVVTLPTGRYLLAARATREFYSETEEYCWTIWSSAKHGVTNEVMLSNHNLIGGSPPDLINLPYLASSKNVPSK